MWPTPTAAPPIITETLSFSITCDLLNEYTDMILGVANTNNFVNITLWFIVVMWAFFVLFGVRLRMPGSVGDVGDLDERVERYYASREEAERARQREEANRIWDYQRDFRDRYE